MKAALRTFLLLLAPGLLVLLGGLASLLRTGQVDPRGWMAPALLLIPAAALIGRRRTEGVVWWIGLGTVGMVLSCLFLAAWRVPALVPLTWWLAVALVAVIAGLMLRAPAKAGAGRIAGAGLALLAVAMCWLARIPPFSQRPILPKWL